MATITAIGTAGRHRRPEFRWITDPSRAFMLRLAAGVRALDFRPTPCRYTDPLRSPAHALHVRHIHHRHQGCPRYAMAQAYLMANPE
jgi:hypothetical protein